MTPSFDYFYKYLHKNDKLYYCNITEDYITDTKFCAHVLKTSDKSWFFNRATGHKPSSFGDMIIYGHDGDKRHNKEL